MDKRQKKTPKGEKKKTLDEWRVEKMIVVYHLLENTSAPLSPLYDEKMSQILNYLSGFEPFTQIEESNDAPKSATKSTEFRYEGNLAFQANKMDNAHESYTKGICHAPPGSPEITFVYANRSAVLFKSKLFAECLKDIERVEKNNNYPDDLKAKLYYRKAYSFQVLRPDDNLSIERAFSECAVWINKMDPKKQAGMKELVEKREAVTSVETKNYDWEWLENPPKLESENSMVPGLSDAVELRYSKEFGRHIVAVREIKTGEILTAQKPYIKVAENNFRYKICSHCGKQTWASIPCDDCANAIYCSEDCRYNARREYHDVECYVLQQMLAYNTTYDFIPVIRLVIVALRDNGYSLEQLKKTLDMALDTPDTMKRGFVDDKYQPFNIATFHALMPHRLEDTLDESRYIIHAILLSYFLAKRCNLVKQLNNMPICLKDKGDFLYLAGFTLKTWEIFCRNSSGFSLLTKDLTSKRIMSAVIPVFGLFNHSCFPTVLRSSHGDYMINRAARPIEKGEQIFDNYMQYAYYDNPKKNRQEYLKNFGFTCHCVACKNDWKDPKDKNNRPAESKIAQDEISEELSLMTIKLNIMRSTIDSLVRDNSANFDVTDDVNKIIQLIDDYYYRFDENAYTNVMLESCFKTLVLMTKKHLMSLDDD